MIEGFPHESEPNKPWDKPLSCNRCGGMPRGKDVCPICGRKVNLTEEQKEISKMPGIMFCKDCGIKYVMRLDYVPEVLIKKIEKGLLDASEDLLGRSWRIDYSSYPGRILLRPSRKIYDKGAFSRILSKRFVDRGFELGQSSEEDAIEVFKKALQYDEQSAKQIMLDSMQRALRLIHDLPHNKKPTIAAFKALIDHEMDHDPKSPIIKELMSMLKDLQG